MVVNFYTITSFINFLTSIILAVLVILKNKKSQKNVAFFTLSVIISLWSLSYFFWQNVTDNEAVALFWCRVLSIFLILVPPAYLHFTLALTETIEKRKKFLTLVYLFFYVFILIDVTPFFIDRVEPIMNFKYWPMATPLFSAYVLCFVVCMSYSSFLLIKKFKASTGIVRMQIKYVALGFIITIISGSSNFLPWYKIMIPPVFNALVPFYVICMAYAITRYKLMDVKILARNMVFYFGISFFLYASFYGIALAYKIAFGDVLSQETYFIGLFIAPGIALLLYTSGNLFSKFINKSFFTSIYTYQQTIKEASYNLSRHTSLNEIAEIIIDAANKTVQPINMSVMFVRNLESPDANFEIAKNMGMDSSSLQSVIKYSAFKMFFQDRDEILTRDSLEQIIQRTKDIEERSKLHDIENQLHACNIHICIPLKNNANLLGLIVAGNKQYENAYSQEDFNLLETVSYYAQIAADNVFLYQKIEEENAYLKQTLTNKSKK